MPHLSPKAGFNPVLINWWRRMSGSPSIAAIAEDHEVFR